MGLLSDLRHHQGKAQRLTGVRPPPPRLLNFIEKLHCTYCEYGNGLMGYMAEILARTEPYFCPIKHANKIMGTHARYNLFLAYGDHRPCADSATR